MQQAEVGLRSTRDTNLYVCNPSWFCSATTTDECKQSTRTNKVGSELDICFAKDWEQTEWIVCLICKDLAPVETNSRWSLRSICKNLAEVQERSRTRSRVDQIENSLVFQTLDSLVCNRLDCNRIDGRFRNRSKVFVCKVINTGIIVIPGNCLV